MGRIIKKEVTEIVKGVPFTYISELWVCSCGTEGHKRYDGNSIYIGIYCDDCANTPSIQHMLNHKHDYLDAGEYLDEDY